MKLFVFYTSCFFAFVAGHMVNYTAILYGLEKFDSSLLAGLAYGFCFGPPILFGWIAGAYIDRYSPKRVLLIAQNFFILGALGMLCVMIYEPIYSVLLFLLSCFFVGVGWAFVAPARLSSMGSYVTGDQLTQATITFNLLIMLGFGLAPIIITQIQLWYNWQGVAVLCILMFTISSLLLLNAPNHHRRISHEKLKQEWLECFDELRKIPVVPQLLFAAIIGYLMMGPMQVILPQIAESQLGLNPQEKGQYLGLIALSLILGGVAAMKLKSHVPIGRTILLLLLMCGVSLILIGAISNVWVSCFVLIMGTTFAGVVVSFIVAGLQHFTPVFIRGRVMSIYTIISQVVSAMAGVLAGAIAQGLSVPLSLFIIGALFVVATVILILKGKHLIGFKAFN
ncbi:MFS transporter [Bermanella sp. WJH001]|uniref:MFS transporter n=1 Tax=Bermanella sp. WJH001 TaxID=3048005 RepID=UPI0024BDE463|nr:MFS transporter [Bermanella sp. WJH001]MDJ1536893.1 MFS transporter [Bermanella sp. WJH001]